MYLKIISLFCIFSIGFCDEYHPKFRSHKPTKNTGEGVSHWLQKGKSELDKALKARNEINENKAKNVIIFVGDGMSLPTLTAARIYKAQRNTNFDKSVRGEETSLFFETFPHVGLSKVSWLDVVYIYFIRNEINLLLDILSKSSNS